MSTESGEKIGLINAVSIGIGGMVGGGIFAVLGLAASMAKGGTPQINYLLSLLFVLFYFVSY